MRLGVFGGSFDPVHVGHLAIALAALDCVPLDRVVFVPARRSPLKAHGPVATSADRLAMLRLATGDEPRFSVSTLELDRPGESYTVATLEALADQGELFLILGADAASDLPRWHEPERISELATLLVAARPGVAAAGGHRTFDAPALDLSSRELRARAARGRSLRYLVPEAALGYLEEHRLYRTNGDPSRTPS